MPASGAAAYKVLEPPFVPMYLIHRKTIVVQEPNTPGRKALAFSYIRNVTHVLGNTRTRLGPKPL